MISRRQAIIWLLLVVASTAIGAILAQAFTHSGGIGLVVACVVFPGLLIGMFLSSSGAELPMVWGGAIALQVLYCGLLAIWVSRKFGSK